MLTTDPKDPRLTHGADPADALPGPQAEIYLVLSEEERKKGFIRPFRNVYVHDKCGTETRMGKALSETYARAPNFYGSTYCSGCGIHRPVGPNGEFRWLDGDRVGS